MCIRDSCYWVIFTKQFNPVTVSNFIENIENNIYVNQKFYKIINFAQIRFIHGGVKPENKLYIEPKQNLNKASPSIPLEIKFKEEIKPRYNYQIKNPNEIENLVNTFEAGSIAMVKRNNNKSSSTCLLYTSPSPRDPKTSRMPSSA